MDLQFGPRKVATYRLQTRTRESRVICECQVSCQVDGASSDKEINARARRRPGEITIARLGIYLVLLIGLMPISCLQIDALWFVEGDVTPGPDY